MQTSCIIATLITLVGVAATSTAHAGERYAFPSPNGVQLSSAPVPSFGSAPLATGSVATGSFVYGAVGGHHRHETPPPPPLPLANYRSGDAYAFLSRTLTGAAYANYTADYARLFAPGYAVSAWTGRVFGVVEQGYGAVDAWTGATYGLGRVRGPSRASAPDLSLMPQLRSHPELEQRPVFLRDGN